VSDVLATASALRLGANRLSRRLRAQRPRDALSTARLAVLADLYRDGDQTAGQLAAAQRVQPQSLTRVLAALEGAGLIARRRDLTDRRQVRLTLSAAGATALADDMALRDRWLSTALTRLTPAERALLHLAGELMERLAAE
jgi:DNA-binding MarR family transcriptional regulator